MKNKLGKVVQMIVVNKTLHVLTDRGSVYAYREGALESGFDGWEALSDLTPNNVVPAEDDDQDEEEEDEADED
jgi:hypothetical protein